MMLSSRFRNVVLTLGALALAGVPARAQNGGAAVVALPPFMVQDAGGPPWRYAQLPGFEVLSRWSDSKTEEFATQLAAARALFEQVLPPEFQVQFSVPTTYLLVPDGMTDALPAPLMAQVLAHAPATAGAGRPTEVRFMPNLMLWDRDALDVFGLQPNRSAENTRLIFSNSRVQLALERRVPALPRWFIFGFYDLYSGMEFDRGGAATGPSGWISRANVTALAADPETPRQLLPLAELFDPAPPAASETPEHRALFQAEAALFIRWALDGEGHPRRAAFWRFVNDSSGVPPTEHHFEELFGEDYVSALNDLSDYLPWAVAHSLRVVPIQDPPDVSVRLRNASAAEVGRIKGDWERLEMDRVATQFPELVPKYRDHARETLNLAYAEDKKDPGLLAVMGLFNLDCGSPLQAEAYLAEAVAGHVVRPRAYYEYARLRLAEATKPLPDSTAPTELSRGEAASLLALLDQARAQGPALPEVYGLYFQIAVQTNAQPGPALLKVFSEGAHLFPENPALIYETALMLARGGELNEANALVQQGLGIPAAPQLHAHLASLQGALASALKAQANPRATP